MTQKRWRTALSNFKAEPETIAGYRLTDIMQNLDFAGSLFVLYQQRIPNAKESRLLNAVLVSVLDHSIVAPSVMSRHQHGREGPRNRRRGPQDQSTH